MGPQHVPVTQSVKATNLPPAEDEIEITLFGPGYGESIALHIGDGTWVLVDSCIDPSGEPRALRYLTDLGVDPARDVRLVVATHWHDDHIRGMAKLITACSNAVFCCASVLCRQEFLALVGTYGPHRVPGANSGVRELYEVFSKLDATTTKPRFALADSRIFLQGACEIWALSPNSAAFLNFLRQVDSLLPGQGETRRRIPSLTPNKVSVVLWVNIGDVALLLGSDMEKPGWADILHSTTRPTGKASVFKIPHHGSGNADDPGVWQNMLQTHPWAVLAPWRRGGHTLPRQVDVRRILSCTPNGYSTMPRRQFAASPVRRENMVNKTLQEAGVKLRSVSVSPGAVQLRRAAGKQAQWQVELFGSACALKDFAA